VKQLTKLFFLGTFFLFSSKVFGQVKKDSIKNGMNTPSLVTGHHFGIFSSRINQSFNEFASRKKEARISYHSSNVFHPVVKGYYPQDPIIQQQLSEVIWYDRRFDFVNQTETPSDYVGIKADAVIKEFRMEYVIPINQKSELKLGVRTHLFSKGKMPFSFFASDDFIEWFHDNVAGGHDPFGRRYYGMNEVGFQYTDRKGRKIEIDKNTFFFSGVEAHYYLFPEISFLKRKNVFLNLGVHTGLNTSKYNFSIDLGFSTNIHKKWVFKNKNEFRLGGGVNILRKNTIDFKEPVDLGNNKYLGGGEFMFEFTKYTRKQNYHSFAVNYQIHTPYFKSKEADYYVIKGAWDVIHSGWQRGVEQLHVNQSNWNFIYTYGRKWWSLNLYLKQDFLVNNAPDIQTGISLNFPLL